MRYLLIYDSNCRFCRGLALYFKHNLKIKILSNKKCKGFKFLTKNRIEKDVHLVKFPEIIMDYGVGFYDQDIKVYSGSRVAVELFSIKFPILRFFSPMIRILYLIVKKYRKHF